MNEKKHRKNVVKYLQQTADAYKVAIDKMTALYLSIPNITEPFSWSDYPTIQPKLNKILQELTKSIETTLINGVKVEASLVAESLDDFSKVKYLAESKELVAVAEITKALSTWEQSKAFKQLTSTSIKASEQFAKRIVNGENFSARVWNYSKLLKEDFQLAIQAGIAEGKSASVISKTVREALKEPNKLFRAVRDKETGKMRLSKSAKEYKPGQGVYRSSYKNALRLVGSETNIAYRKTSFEVMQSPFLKGWNIKLSNNHTSKDGKGGFIANFFDMCDILQGEYPPDFMFTIWHPNCYSDDTEILTNRGWLFFKDLKADDLIYSLNPETRVCEWVGISLYLSRHHKGDMYHFHSRNLDCLVTPEHEMVYLCSYDKSIRKVEAKDYTIGKGAFYRGHKWGGTNAKTITIGSKTFNFDDYCEFMGYWLADGSLMRDRQVQIAKRNGNPIKNKMKAVITRMGLSPNNGADCVSFACAELNVYLRQFGKAPDKFIPAEIKNASQEQIKIFLDAFISCDGHIKPAKSFKGNRGGICTPKNDERLYFTSSEKLSADIGECILKIGKRPSYRVMKTKGKTQKFENGEYTINQDQIIISECNSLSASTFKKNVVPYDAIVYDVTLERNHIMYIRRNGKCYWGSNCRCQAIQIKDDNFESVIDYYLNDDQSQLPKDIIKDVPQQYKDYVNENKPKWKKLPFWYTDNPKYQ